MKRLISIVLALIMISLAFPGITFVAASPELPDLVIRSINCDRENNRIGYDISNTGVSIALPLHRTTLWVDGRRVCEDSVSAVLFPGGTYTSWFECYDWPAYKTIRVKVCADGGNIIAEHDEGNNCLEETCVPPVTRLPDLVIRSIDCDRENNRIGYTIENIGSAIARASHRTTLWVDDRRGWGKGEVVRGVITF